MLSDFVGVLVEVYRLKNEDVFCKFCKWKWKLIIGSKWCCSCYEVFCKSCIEVYDLLKIMMKYEMMDLNEVKISEMKSFVYGLNCMIYDY